jgi:long-chain acyl-CoA synthetase
LEAAVLGIPIDGKGQRIKAYVVLKPGETATEEEILLFCKENLAVFKVPKTVEFRETLPKTLVGKILRRELASEEAKKQGGRETSIPEGEEYAHQVPQ